MGKRVVDMTPEEHAATNERQRQRRANTTAEQRAALKKRRSVADMTLEEHAVYKKRKRERTRESRAKLTTEQRDACNARRREHRATHSLEKREARKAKQRERDRKRLATRTPAQCEKRLAAGRAYRQKMIDKLGRAEVRRLQREKQRQYRAQRATKKSARATSKPTKRVIKKPARGRRRNLHHRFERALSPPFRMLRDQRAAVREMLDTLCGMCCSAIFVWRRDRDRSISG